MCANFIAKIIKSSTEREETNRGKESKLNYKYMQAQGKILSDFFKILKLEKLTIKFIWKSKEAKVARKRLIRRLVLLDIKII